MTKIEEAIPPVSWAEVETMLLALATTPTKELMVHHLVEGARKQARFLTPTGVLTEICLIAAALLDPKFTGNPLDSDISISGASSLSSESPPRP